MEIEIRKARVNDRGEIAEMIYSSGADLYDFIYKGFGRTAKDYINYEFESGKGFCGHQNVSVITADEVVVGTGCFYSGKDYKWLVLGSIRNVLSYYGPFKGAVIMRRMLYASSVVEEPANDELYLSNFGVDVNYRGGGYGSRFLSKHIEAAKADGYRIVSLDVSARNPRAEKLYNSLGFKFIKEKQFSGNDPDVNNARKMELVLRQ